jgi:hypothetical protein
MSALVSAPPAVGPVVLRSIVALAIAAGLLAITPQALGSYALRVHVRWSAETNAQGRQYLERRLHLLRASDLGNNSFRYLLTDSSPSGIRALVTHPAVADTHYIDRAAFAPVRREALYEWVEGRAGRSGLVLRPTTIAIAWSMAAFGFASAAIAGVIVMRPAMLGTLPPGVLTIVLTPLAALRIAGRATAAFLQRGIPIASPGAAGAFRIVFGACALAIAARAPVGTAALDPGIAGALDGGIAPVLAGWAWLVPWLQPWLLASGALFIAGAATRVSFAAFTAAFLAWATVTTLQGGSHAIVSLAMTLVALLPSRWGDGLSVDAWLRRRPAPAPSRRYGFSIWAPGFMLGIAFAAAAWSKVKAGPTWIANGTVKYHFLTDAPDAYVDWGVRLTRDNEALAIAASAAVVVVEALLITAAFSRSRLHKAVLGLGAVLLFGGFVLFQGVVWPAWWVLFLSFLPWERLWRGPADASTVAPAASAHRASVPQLACIAAVALQQVYVSGVSLEVPPLFSAYDMYSASYDSMEQYEQNLRDADN